jgi:hypothetical protein
VTGNIKGAGDLVAMHLLAVLALMGNCINRDFLRNATLGQACKKQVWEKIFNGLNVTPCQMKSGLKGVVRKMKLTPFMMENLLCEALRPQPGFDTFHPSQSISFLEDDTDDIVCVTGDMIILRSAEYDQRQLQQLPTKDKIVPDWMWWEAPQGERGMHDWFVQCCTDQEIDPSSLFVRPHNNAKVKQTPLQIWRHYVTGVEKKEGNGKCNADVTVKEQDPKQERQVKKGRRGRGPNLLSRELHI